MSGPSFRLRCPSTPSSLCLAVIGQNNLSATDLAPSQPDKTSLSSDSFRRHNKLVEELAPGVLVSVNVGSSLDMVQLRLVSLRGLSSKGPIRCLIPRQLVDIKPLILAEHYVRLWGSMAPSVNVSFCQSMRDELVKLTITYLGSETYSTEAPTTKRSAFLLFHFDYSP